MGIAFAVELGKRVVKLHLDGSGRYKPFYGNLLFSETVRVQLQYLYFRRMHIVIR
jgi:hypothetical protein